ncbi:MAG: DivIVA domain-containing protein [Streptomycetaceae bacterium]|nr:DivIVA domain-containing protein [Streptomycetaceae bacterium]
MFWFMLIALVVVVAAVALAVLGDGGALSDAEPDRLHDQLPDDRPLGRADLDTLRLPTALRGYRTSEVDDVLDRLGAELTERDARIAELEAALAGAPASQQRPQPLRHPSLGEERSGRTGPEGP